MPKGTNQHKKRCCQTLTSHEIKIKIDAFLKLHPFNAGLRESAMKHGTLSSRSASKKFNLPGISDYQHYKEQVKNAIDPDNYECANTEIDGYIQTSVSNWTSDDFNWYFSWGFMPFDYVYIFDNTDGGQSYGATGKFTNALNRTISDLKKFWDIPTDILMPDCHGNIMSNKTKLVALIGVYNTLGYFGNPGLSSYDISDFADMLVAAFGSTGYRNYTHPLLTFNAFASPADPDFNTPKKIVMGDGIVQAYADLGYADVAPQAILAHEFGHQVQFANNVVFDYSPEGTRRTELMADAFAGYYLTSKKGAAMNKKRVQEFLTIFYDIGDCQFDNPDHHGTPNQRMKAAMWGFTTADDAQKKGKVYSSAQMISMFDAILSTITAPDKI